MNIKHIADNGGIYFNVDTEQQQKKLRPMLRPIVRQMTNMCHTCTAISDKLIFNATISEIQCEECFHDWEKCYILSQEDYKCQAYNAESAERLLTKE